MISQKIDRTSDDSSMADVGGQRCPDSARNYCAVSIGQNQVKI